MPRGRANPQTELEEKVIDDDALLTALRLRESLKPKASEYKKADKGVKEMLTPELVPDGVTVRCGEFQIKGQGRRWRYAGEL